MTTTALATYDDATLEMLASMASPSDVVAAGPDILKINYDEDSIHPRGVWVLGQRKKDNVITEEGVRVDKIVILAARYRYSYYHEATGEAVSTMVFEAGSQPPDKAVVDAKVAILGGQLKFQTVLYGVALTEEGGLKDFVSYQGGVAYQPLKALLADLSVYVSPKGRINSPLFSCVTVLGETRKDKKGTITFYHPSFKKGGLMTPEQLKYFAKKRDEVVNYIAQTNEMAREKAETSAPVAPPTSGIYTPPPSARPPVDVDSLASAMPPSPAPPDDPPFDTGIDIDSFDIEREMEAILRK